MIRRIVTVVFLALGGPALAADVAGSIAIDQPGFYGRIDIGGYPQPQVINPQPVFVQRGPPGPPPPPLYLRVPPGHAKHWSKHCARYGACGQPVYFVRDDWYRRVYVPRYHEMHGGGPRRERHGDDDGRRDDDRPGKGKGRGHRD